MPDLTPEEKDEATRTLNFLARTPERARTSITTRVLQEIMLQTSGEMLAWSVSWDIKSKRLAPGVYKVWLEKRDV